MVELDSAAAVVLAIIVGIKVCEEVPKLMCCIIDKSPLITLQQTTVTTTCSYDHHQAALLVLSRL